MNPIVVPLQTFTCSKPLHELLADGVHNWLICPHSLQGAGQLGTGMMIWLIVAVIMTNNSEGVRLPLAWTALMAPFVMGMVPGSFAHRLLGLLTLAVAAAFFLVWQIWNR